MTDIKQASKITIFFKSGRELSIKKSITLNYNQLINWLFSNDDIPFKVNSKDDVEDTIVKDFILYKEAIESIEALK
ncbi:hypothetical protein DIC82_02155 [Clostridium beijerinckii]|nr:hypothetical protein DIC82_02155 [Clostridium beijerinckii]